MKKTITVVTILLAVTAAACVLFLQNGLLAEETKGQITVSQGMNTENIAELLKENQMISNKLAFKLAARLTGTGARFKPGNYSLSNKMSYWEITSILAEGKSGVTVTIPEGYTVEQIGLLLESKELTTAQDFYDTVAQGEFDYWFISDAMPKGKTRLEGFLFSDTYSMYKGMTAEQITAMMLDRFEQVFTEDYRRRAEELGFTVNEAVTLASIIEKEGQQDLDVISSVFHNRLKDKTRPYLESCATVNYVLGTNKKVLSYADIAIDSPYNTYKNKGLPPAPIGAPGKAAIEAALYPAETDYYFFVADGKGKNHFSVTYEEHLEKQRSFLGG